MAGASLLAEAVANALPARGPGVPAWPFFIRVHQSNRWLNLGSAFPRGPRTFCHSQECWSNYHEHYFLLHQLAFSLAIRYQRSVYWLKASL
jgi:hypothetical protein